MLYINILRKIRFG